LPLPAAIDAQTSQLKTLAIAAYECFLCGPDSPPTVASRRKEKGTTRPEGYGPPKADNSILGTAKC
jgi:hypothetical protein